MEGDGGRAVVRRGSWVTHGLLEGELLEQAGIWHFSSLEICFTFRLKMLEAS